MSPAQTRRALEALIQPVAPVAEHHTLARLNGAWLVQGEWHIVPGQPPVPFSAQMLNAGILGGHFIESRTLYDGQEGSRVIYGYDPDDGRFIAFAINAITARSDIEYGHYDADNDVLRFQGTEPVGPERRPMRFERILRFLSPDALQLLILHPEMDEGKQVGMALNITRCAVSGP